VPPAGSRIDQELTRHNIAGPRALLLDDAHNALTSRLMMIDAADTTLDLQYFIWQNDSSGILLIEKVLAAADRGVRVRALLDDVQLDGLVNRLNALNDHPNIEIRIFNPFSVRWRYELGIWRLAEFAIDGNRLNHRMHNKLLVADNQLAMLGGRNIGDDYFGRSRERNFVDLDLILTGTIVQDLSNGFDAYWNSRWAYPVNALLNLSVIPDDLDRLRVRVRERLAGHPTLDDLANDRDVRALFNSMAGGVDVIGTRTIIDDPSVFWFEKPDELAHELTKIVLSAQHEVLIVTPYLILTANMLALGEELTARGVTISAVTNSLQTNDVVIAQAAYARDRRRIVDAGVNLYEFRADSDITRNDPARDVSLHQKYIVIDDRFVFLGSVNLDPRSLYLNTELGVVLDSPELAAQLRRSFQILTQPQNSWKILVTNSTVEWHSTAGVARRPQAKSLWQRLRFWFFSWLPVSRQL
jgi:putative cardiolipin synthase